MELYSNYITGYRIWRISPDAELVSYSQSTVWEPGIPVKAFCRLELTLLLLYGGGYYLDHSTHKCGIYAYNNFDILCQYLYFEKPVFFYSRRFVIGKVALWGKVFEHELGYRAEYAYPLSIDWQMDNIFTCRCAYCCQLTGITLDCINKLCIKYNIKNNIISFPNV